MPLIIPIQDHPAVAQTVEGVFAGNTDLQGVLSVRFGLRGSLSGGTSITGSLGGTVVVNGVVDGRTTLTGFMRLNAEANVFMAGSLSGGTDVQAPNMQLGLTGNAAFHGSTNMVGSMTVTSADEPFFVLAADILSGAIAGQSNVRRYMPRLLADGAEVKIRKASVEASADTLGTEVRVTLLVPDAGLVSQAALLTFQVGLWSGGTFHFVDLVTNGRLSSRGNTLKNEQGRPSDEVTLSIVDVIGDRWNRAPRQPIHLYDPTTAATPTESDLDANRIEVLGVGYIVPVNVALPGMRLFDVLTQAYVDGCGFDAVICNIPDFPVSEVDFTLDGGFDAGVRPLLSLFTPVVFERDNTLYIVDPDAPLPAGMTPRDFTHAQTRELSDSLPQHEPVNALLIRTRGSDAGEYFTERLDTESTASGVFGTTGFTTTDIERRIREYRNFAAPTVVVREELVSEKTTVEDFELNVIEQTTETVSFDAFNRKTGSVKRANMRLPNLNAPGAPLTLLSDVTRQDQAITYRQDPQDPRRDLQDRVVTRESGLVVVDAGNPYLGNPYRIPILDAHRSGYINTDGGQSLSTEDIRTTTEQLRVRGLQVDVEVRVVNHISDTTTRNTTTTRPATASTSRRDQARGRTILLTVVGTDTQGRRAQVLDTGDLPYEVAVALGQRKLARLNSPPREVSMAPAYVDVTLRRGTVVQLKKRTGSALGNYIVRGYSIEFAEYDPSAGVVASMSANARELLT